MTSPRTPLYGLLPSVYRQRDADQGGVLEQFLAVIDEQIAVVEDNIAQLYDDWFVETAEEWAVPYIGQLIGYSPVPAAGPPAETLDERGLARDTVLIPRREVANTIAFRRRKGTIALLADLSEAVAGWPALAVELYRLLGWAPHLGRQYTPRLVASELATHAFCDVRDADRLAQSEGAFGRTAHGDDVRRISSARTPGRFGIPNVALHAWRLRAYGVTDTAVQPHDDIAANCFSFSAIGHDTQLFTHPRDPDPLAPRGPLDVPAPIARSAFGTHTATRPVTWLASTDYYGPGKSLSIRAFGWPRKSVDTDIPAADVLPADLSDWARYRPPPGKVAVDPVLGRIVFPPSRPPRRIHVTYHYGFSADLGGGEYDRRIPSRSARALSRFADEDVIAASELLDDLQARKGSLATYLAARWSPEHAVLLMARPMGTDPDAPLLAALVAELNLVLDDAGLFTQGRFATIDADLLALAEQLPPALTFRLNRRLLEEALPTSIAQSYKRYVVAAGDEERSPLWPSVDCATLDAALGLWRTDGPRNGVIELARSGVYSLDAQIADDADALIVLAPSRTLRIVAANRTRPVVTIDSGDELSVAMGARSELDLDGLLVAEGAIVVHRADPATPVRSECDERPRLRVRNCTLVPGWALNCDCDPRRPGSPSIELTDFGGVVCIARSIVGPLRIEEDIASGIPVAVDACDSILDATGVERECVSAAGPGFAFATLRLRRVTVIGTILAHAVELGENTIFVGLVRVARRQTGCLRFCSVTPDSRTPRRFHCQPDAAVADAIAQQVDANLPPDERAALAAIVQEAAQSRVRPRFSSVRYGRPDYCQLAADCAPEISRGADDESEMGGFHDLYQPQRTANLTTRLREFTPAGADVAIVFAT
jgi:hypothetical protein